jgi:hypothetical protein
VSDSQPELRFHLSNNRGTNAVKHEHLLTGSFSMPIDWTETHLFEQQGGHEGGVHVNPGGVVGYVMDGQVLLRADEQAVRTLRPRNAFYEPPGASITHFDNTSATVTASFIAFYPLTGDQQQTMALLERFEALDAQFRRLVPYPGT